MKILWLSSGFLHPTDRGGQIRTLELLRRLRTRHEIHYLAFHDGRPEALSRSFEYCFKAWPVPFKLKSRSSPSFWIQTAGAAFSHLPVVVARKQSRTAQHLITEALNRESFDLVVCDFLTPAVNLPSSQPFILFEHNVETVIWQRYATQVRDPIRRAFFGQQAEKLLAFERAICRRATHVIAVSEFDAKLLSDLCSIAQVSAVPTGVDAGSFLRPTSPSRDTRSLLFTGSMDWLPNIDGVLWFVRDALPLVRQHLPDLTLTIAGRRPAASIRRLASLDSNIRVTGRVDDIRPYLWNAGVSIVPLRIGSGTRLKIYEAMAAEVPVISTTIGAEGLDVSSPENIRLADSTPAFANACVELLINRQEHARQSNAALRLIRQYSWESVADRLEEILLRCRTPGNAHR